MGKYSSSQKGSSTLIWYKIDINISGNNRVSILRNDVTSVTNLIEKFGKRLKDELFSTPHRGFSL